MRPIKSVRDTSRRDRGLSQEVLRELINAKEHEMIRNRQRQRTTCLPKGLGPCIIIIVMTIYLLSTTIFTDIK